MRCAMATPCCSKSAALEKCRLGRVSGGFGVQGLRGLGSPGLRGLGFGVWGLGFGGQGLGFRAAEAFLLQVQCFFGETGAPETPKAV